MCLSVCQFVYLIPKHIVSKWGGGWIVERVLITEAVGEYMSIVWLFIAHEKRAEIYLFFYGGDSQTNQLVAHLHSVKQTSKQLWTPRDEMNKKKRWGLK